MKNIFKKLLFFTLSTVSIFSTTVANADDIPIHLFSNKKGINLVPMDKLTDVVKKYIAPLSQKDYSQAKMQVIYDKQNQPDYLLVYLLSAKDYSFTITKIKLNEHYQAVLTEPNYRLEKRDLEQQPTEEPTCPDKTIEFVAATPVPGISTAKEAIEYVYEKAIVQGYKAQKLLGNEASVANYKNWLTCPNLKGFFNVGHGDPEEIILSDGVLSNEFFNNTLKDKLHERTVILFNSCSVHNNPLKDAVTERADAQKYAGGVTPLLIGPSELVSRCFWDAAFNKQNLTASIKDCNQKFDSRDIFGIDGHGIDIFNNAA